MSKILIYVLGATIAALGIALGVSLLALKVKGAELTRANADAVVLRATVADYKSANESNLTSIAMLSLANRQCAEKNAADAALTATYFNAERDYAAQLQVAKTKAEHAIQVIYEHDPSARQWARPVVPAVLADRLRANAGAGSPHPNG